MTIKINIINPSNNNNVHQTILKVCLFLSNGNKKIFLRVTLSS